MGYRNFPSGPLRCAGRHGGAENVIHFKQKLQLTNGNRKMGLKYHPEFSLIAYAPVSDDYRSKISNKRVLTRCSNFMPDIYRCGTLLNSQCANNSNRYKQKSPKESQYSPSFAHSFNFNSVVFFTCHLAIHDRPIFDSITSVEVPFASAT
jgi:hypothetical protein